MRKSILLALTALLCGFQVMTAIPAYPGKIEYVQPDGTKIVLRQHGDEFALLKASTNEQLVVFGYDPSLTKGDAVTVSLQYRKGRKVLLERTCALRVVREDGPKVWLGDGSGQGFILKK